MVLEANQDGGHCLGVERVVWGHHFWLHDRKADLHPVESGIDSQVDKPEPGPLYLQAVDRSLPVVGQVESLGYAAACVLLDRPCRLTGPPRAALASYM